MNKKTLLTAVSIIAFSIVVTWLGTSAFGLTGSVKDQIEKAKYKVDYHNKGLLESKNELCLLEIQQGHEQLADFHAGKIELNDEEENKYYGQTKQECDTVIKNEVEEEGEATASLSFYPLNPENLYYVFNRDDGISSSNISQSQRQHFASNGYMATDISTNSRYLNVYAPSYEWMDSGGVVHDDSKEYTAKVVKNHGTMGLTVELHWIADEVNKSYAIGHMKEVWITDGQTVKTGERIGSSGGCKGDLQMDEVSTGCHTHFEYRIEEKASPYPEYTNSPHGENLEAIRKHRKQVANVVYYDINETAINNFFNKYSSDKLKDKGEVVYNAGIVEGINPALIAAIIQQETSGGKSIKSGSGNNVSNVGNNDRGDTVYIDSVDEAIYRTAETLNNQYMGKHIELWGLSAMGLSIKKNLDFSEPNPCSDQPIGYKCYSTGFEEGRTWHKNVKGFMSEMLGENISDDFNFRI